MSSSTAVQPAGYFDNVYNDVKSVATELLFVVGAVLVAGMSDQAANVILAVMVTLGVIYLINRYGG